ncbi:MAG: TolC family protein [Christiangramia sp.]
MKLKLFSLIFIFSLQSIFSQENSLDYFLNAAEKNNPALLQNSNLQKIGDFESQLINAENSFQVDVTSEVMVAPFFDSNGHFIEVTTTPSRNAYGYAEPVSNGALYSTQLNIAKDIFNRSKVQNLLFQNKLNNTAIRLSNEDVKHQIQKNVTEAYIQVYQLQLKQQLTKELISDLENRLKVVELLVKKGLLMQSDYLLLQLEIENKKLELQQSQNNLNSNLLRLNNAVGLKTTELQNLAEPELQLDPSLDAYLTNISSEVNPATDSLEMNQMEFANEIKPKLPNDSIYYERKFKNDSLQLVAEQQVFENKYRPQLTAYGNTGLNAVEWDRLSHNIGFSAGLKLTVPIYDGGQRNIKHRQNELKFQNLEVQLKNQEVKRENTLQSLREQMASVKTGMGLIKAQLEKQKNIMEIYKGKMVQGQVSIIDYLKVVENYKVNLETQLQMRINLWLLQNEYNATNW